MHGYILGVLTYSFTFLGAPMLYANNVLMPLLNAHSAFH